MAYEAQYQGEFCNKSGETIFISINKRSNLPFVIKRIIFAGEGDKPVTISYPNKGDIKTEHVNGSECTIRIKAVDGFDLQSMYTADEREYQVVISGAWNWTGFVIPDSCNEPFISPPYDVQISATDALGTLKDLPFQTDLQTNIKGWYNDYQMLSMALSKTGLQLPMAIGVNMFEDSMLNNLSPLVQAYIRAERYIDVDQTAFSCHEVIRSILARYTARLRQWDGQWQIVSAWELSQGSCVARVFAYGQPTQESTLQLVNTAIAGGYNRDLRPVGNTSLAKAYAGFTAYYQYGYIANQLLNGNMDTWTSKPNGLPDGWEVVQGTGNVYATTGIRKVNGVDTTDYFITVGGQGSGHLRNNNEVQVRGNDTASINFDFLANTLSNGGSGSAYLSLLITDDNGQYFTNAGWTSAAGYYVIKYPTKNDWNNQISVSFNLNPQTEDYKVKFAILPIGVPFNNQHFDTAINNVNINSGSDSAVKAPLGAFSRKRLLTTQTYTPDPLLLLQGDDTNDQRTSQILIGSATGSVSNAWLSPGLPVGDLLETVSATNLRMHARPYQIFEADFIGYGEINPNTLLTVDLIDGAFIFLSGDFDLKSDIHNLRFAQVLTAAVTATTQRAEDYGTITGKDGLAVGAPSGISLPSGGSSGISLDGVILNQSEYQEDAEFNVYKGVFQNTLIVPSVVPASVVAGQSAFWIGNLSGITNDTGGGGGGSATLSGLTDVSLTGLAAGQILVYNGSVWTNQTLNVDLSNYYNKTQSDARFVQPSSWVVAGFGFACMLKGFMCTVNVTKLTRISNRIKY